MKEVSRPVSAHRPESTVPAPAPAASVLVRNGAAVALQRGPSRPLPAPRGVRTSPVPGSGNQTAVTDTVYIALLTSLLPPFNKSGSVCKTMEHARGEAVRQGTGSRVSVEAGR